MAKCEICGRGPQFGHNVSHSMKATNRRWNVNVQRVTLIVDGKKKRMNVCTSCLKSMSKAR